MSELRKDLIVNRWVIISPKRGDRPHDFKTEERPPPSQGPCAFCPHHEHETGPETFALRDGALTSSWRVRVVENKFPAVSRNFQWADGVCAASDGIMEGCKLPGFGSHEVVIETPHHEQVFGEFSLVQIEEILKAYQLRIEELRRDKRFRFVQVFKNHGNAAGASMAHSHSQIIALPIITRAMEEDIAGAEAYHRRTGKCVLCDIYQQDTVTSRDRLIEETAFGISVCPYAPRFPFEIWIIPRTHQSNFGTIPAEQIQGLAALMKRTLRKLDMAFNHPPFNYMLHTAPLQECELPYYHWYVRIVPHLITLAGFELGSDCHINPVAPEAAAQLLRNLDAEPQDGV